MLSAIAAITIAVASIGVIDAGRSLVAERSGGTAIERFGDLPLATQGVVSGVVAQGMAEYAATAFDGGFALSNARHGLDFSFTRSGVGMRASGDDMQLALQAAGYGSVLAPVVSASPLATANRVEYVRGSLTEWYVNGPIGVEQGFTLASAPARSGAGPLTLALSVGGSFQPVLDDGGLGISLHGEHVTLFYNGLSAVDAAGRELPARLELSGGSLLVRVDDADAVYPIVIDPVFSAKLTASDGLAADQLGFSVAISGDTIVAGAPTDDVGVNLDQGSAYVFVKPAGAWANATQVAKLVASDGAANDQFGFSVAISGNTIVVGARLDDTVAADRGSAYVFVKPGAGWSGTLTQTAKLLGSDGLASDQLGFSVAVSGTTVVAGAPVDDTGAATNRGSAYVWVQPGAGWAGTLNQTSKLFASDGLLGDLLGWSVGVSGDTVVAGANGDDVGANADQGSAYVFVKPGAGWPAIAVENAKLLASDGAAGDLFGGTSTTGTGIAIDGSTVVVGASFDDVGANTDQGSAYVFVKPGAGWAGTLNQSAKLIASDGAASDFFGFAVSVSGNRVVAGAPLDDVTAADQGSAYVHIRPFAGWSGTVTELSKHTASDAAASDTLGVSVGISNGVIVAGANADDIGAMLNRGSAYVGVSSPAVPTVTKTPTPPSLPEPGGTVNFGVSITNPASSQEPVTVSQMVDTVYGNLNGQGTCATGATLNPGQTYSCSFNGAVTGDANTSHTNIVFVVVTNADGQGTLGGALATVTITDVLPPSPVVTKTPSTATVNEPGGSVTYTVKITNPASAVEAVGVTGLTDDKFGNLNGQGTCATGAVLAPGASYTCSFTKTISGNAGFVHTNTATATVKDNELNAATGSGSATVTVLDVLPTIAVDKTAFPGSVPAPGGPGPGTVTYTVTLKNTSVEPVTVTSLVDSAFGDLNGQGTCATGAVLAPGQTYTCSFDGVVSGPAGTTHTNTVTGRAQDDELNTATDTGSATVSIVIPTAKVTPQFTTCHQFRDGTAQDLNEIKYVVQNGKVATVSSQLFYYTKITAPSLNFSIDVKQFRNNLAFKLFGVQPAQTGFFNANCQKSGKGTVSNSADGSNVHVTVQAAIPGEVFYLGVMYNPLTVVGTPVSTPYPTVLYGFETNVNGVLVQSSREAVRLTPQ
jgi:hypothetical protein